MVGERDHEQQDAVRWEHIDDDAAISIPPPFNSSYNGAIQQQNHRIQQHILQQQHYAAMFAESGGGDDTPVHWDDEQMGLMGDSMAGGDIPVAMEKGVRFPNASPTHAGGFSNGQLSQAPMQSLHSRYAQLMIASCLKDFNFLRDLR